MAVAAGMGVVGRLIAVTHNTGGVAIDLPVDMGVPAGGGRYILVGGAVAVVVDLVTDLARGRADVCRTIVAVARDLGLVPRLGRGLRCPALRAVAIPSAAGKRARPVRRGSRGRGSGDAGGTGRR